MRGTYSASEFDVDDLKKFVDSLQNKGLELEVLWSKGNRSVNPDNGSANMLKLKHNGKLLFSQFKKIGSVSPDILNEDQRDSFLNCLRQYNLYTKPDYSLAIILVTIFSLLELFIVLPGALVRHESLYAYIIGFNVAVFIGLALHYSASALPHNGALKFFAYLILFIGVLPLAPASILCFAFVKQSMHRSLYLRVTQNSDGSLHEEAENTTS